MSNLPPQWGSGNTGDQEGSNQGQTPSSGGGSGEPGYGSGGSSSSGSFGGNQGGNEGGNFGGGGGDNYGGGGGNYGGGGGGNYGNYGQPPVSGESNTQSILSLIAGIVVTLCCCGVGFPIGLLSFPLGIAGAVFSVLAMQKRPTDPTGAAKNQKLAWILVGAGAAIGIVGWIIMQAIGASGAFDDLINSSTSTTFGF